MIIAYLNICLTVLAVIKVELLAAIVVAIRASVDIHAIVDNARVVKSLDLVNILAVVGLHV